MRAPRPVRDTAHPPAAPSADAAARARAPRFEAAALGSLSPVDRDLFQAFGAGPSVVPTHDLVHRAVEARAAARPDDVAARHADDSITYGQLDAHAERLAAELIARGVRPGDAVGLFLERSIGMLVGILAALKAGAAYVPQDARVAPAERLCHVMAVADIAVVLTLSHLRDKVPPAADRLSVDAFMDAADTAAPPARVVIERAVTRDDRCFVLFTSGTTGTPNGVQVTHGNVANIILTEPGSLGMAPGRTVAQLLSISFDMAAWETLGALTHGATLLIRGRDIEQTAARADIVIATPSILATLDADRCRGVRTVAVAGEPCPRPLAERWSRFATFYNACGPTETTIVNTAQRFNDSDGALTIGRPTPNNTVYVLDADRRPLPIGEVGEMWAGGACVTDGYLGNAELTAERYAPDPFLGGDAVMFNTRDLGRWTATGELEHLGRSDDQVKIRGFRVELDAVSAVLESTPGCTKAVTLKYDDRDLVAFVTPATVDPEQARAVVADRLPYYAVPAQVHPMDVVPLTDRGKTDKRALCALASAGRAARGGAAA